MVRSLVPAARSGDLSFPFGSFAALQREMNRLFDETFRGVTPSSSVGADLVPSMDVKETDTAFEVTAEVPGVDEKDVQVTFENGALTIRGEKKAEREEKEEGYYLSERSYGSFCRSIAFDDVDGDKIDARFAKGVLKITVPKLPAEKSKSKKIEIKAEK
jgi:Molecular chaperone (small heat shock protein)